VASAEVSAGENRMFIIEQPQADVSRPTSSVNNNR